MKRLVAIVALGAVLVGVIPLEADAHGAAAAAVAFGAFVVFNALFLPFAIASAFIPPPAVYTTPAPVYAPAPVVYTPRPAPAISRQVVYAHGRYLLYGDGVSRAYQWIWIPNPPPPGSAPGY